MYSTLKKSQAFQVELKTNASSYRAYQQPSIEEQNKEAKTLSKLEVKTLHSSAITFWMIGILAGILSLFGWVMVNSSSIYTIVSNDENPILSNLRKLVFLIIGVGILFLVGLFLKPRFFDRKILINLFFYLTLFMQFLVLTPLGFEVGGNRNQISLGIFSFQPCEVLKIALVIWLSVSLNEINLKSEKYQKNFQQRSKFSRNSSEESEFSTLQSNKVGHDNKSEDPKYQLKTYFPIFIGLGLVYGAIALGKDLGTLAMISLIIVAILWFNSFPFRFFMPMLILGVGLIIFMVVSSENRMERILKTYQGCSEDDYLGTCYQSLHSTYALATGGLFGLGLGHSKQKAGYLPAAEDDFIFAIIGEELGLVGTILTIFVFVLLAFFLYRAIKIVKNPLFKSIIGGVMVWILGQTVVNLLVVVKVLPVLGLPLPFISDGFSSLWSLMLALGVVLALVYNYDYLGANSSVIGARTNIRRNLTGSNTTGQNLSRQNLSGRNLSGRKTLVSDKSYGKI